MMLIMTGRFAIQIRALIDSLCHDGLSGIDSAMSARAARDGRIGCSIVCRGCKDRSQFLSMNSKLFAIVHLWPFSETSSIAFPKT